MISLSTTIQYTTRIVTKFGKLIYDCLRMGMFSSGYIFQVKVDKIHGDIEGIKTYINYILLLIKERFYKHIYQLKLILDILRAASIKVNAPKCSFGLK